MKLVCLNNRGWVSTITKIKANGPKKGDLVTRVGENVIEGKLFYFLEEWPEDTEGFCSTEFIPINNTTKDKQEEVKLIEFTKNKPILAN